MWSSRLRAALAGQIPGKYPNAVCAVSAVSPSCAGQGEQSAQTAQTALAYFGQIDSGHAARLAELAGYCDDRAADLAGAFDAPEVRADREAIASEPLLPEPGTLDRARADRDHAAMLAGLRTTADQLQPKPKQGREHAIA